MKNWRDVSEEPNSPAVENFLSQSLLSLRLERIEDSTKFLLDFVRKQTVLDIGVVGHVIERSGKADWKHSLIKSEAIHTVGIDILENAVLDLQGRGYDVRCVDATSDVDLGERFSRVVIGDVIEHVDNPVALLRFAARHVDQGGLIMCTTPNPFYVGNALKIFRRGILITNAEHVCWITPSNAMELAYRAGVSLNGYHHFGGAGLGLRRRIGVSILKLFGVIKYEMFARSYIYIFKNVG